jgi:hypothetical protein
MHLVNSADTRNRPAISRPGLVRGGSGERRERLVPLETGALLASVVTLIFLLVWPSSAEPVEFWASESGERLYSLNTSLKCTSLLSYAPDDTTLYPERWSAASLWRMRLVLSARHTSSLRAEIAYEQQARLVSESAGGGGGEGVLFSESHVPYRIRQLDKGLVEVGSSFLYRHELDRAFVAADWGIADLVLGRQAVGWGRGIFFGAVDIFNPFSPLESDREWRRGIDAARLGVRVTDTISLDGVAAIGETEEQSSVAVRLRGYLGDVDAELIFGKRCEDYLYALSASTPVLEAELHGELALFKTPEAFPDGGVLGKDDLIAKAVLGSSYTIDVGNAIYLMAEYHFSGFGTRDAEEMEARLKEQDFIERYLRGDTQILGRHAAACEIAYGIRGNTPLSFSAIINPADGSGILIPSLTWTFSDNLTLVAQAYAPYGLGPEGGRARSEYGGAPVSGLLQMSFYY